MLQQKSNSNKPFLVKYYKVVLSTGKFMYHLFVVQNTYGNNY